jgi:hypothetical protein
VTSARVVPLLLLGLFLGLGATLNDVVLGGFNCQSETAYCADGGTSYRWEGRVFDAEGRSGRHVVVGLDFGSVHGGPDVRTRADEAGRFCVLWPGERLVASAEAGAFVGTGRRDPRFAGGKALDPAAYDPYEPRPPPPATLTVRYRAVLMTNNHLLEGGRGVFANRRDWSRRSDSPRHCHATAGPPWDRRDDSFGNWRSVGALAIGLLASATAVVGLLVRRRRVGATLAAAASVLGVAAVVATAVVWGLGLH